MVTVKILGSGCANCKKLEAVAREAATRANLPADVVLYTVSMDLPWAMARWSAAENVGHQGLSSHRDDTFGRDYGVLLKEWRLLQRAVIVIGRDDTVAYAEYVADQMLEPDYDAALAAVRAIV